MSKSGNIWRRVHGKITKKPTNFSWLINDKLAGSGMPTSVSEIDWILKQGVKSIVTMTEDSPAPDMEQIDQAVEFIRNRIESNEPVMVHCAAGIGRTGTILACYLVKYEKISAKNAIQKVRKERPGSIQSESQEIAIGLYYKFLNK